MTLRVLFICTANVSRSPYAQYRAGQLFGDVLHSRSAGIPGTEGRPMDPAMEAQLPYEDAAALAHRSRVLIADILEASDLVLTMEFAHHMRILERWPEAAAKVFGLRQFVKGVGADPLGSPLERVARVGSGVGPNSMSWDVADPYGRGRRAARRCADELDDLILRLGSGMGYEAASGG